MSHLIFLTKSRGLIMVFKSDPPCMERHPFSILGPKNVRPRNFFDYRCKRKKLGKVMKFHSSNPNSF